MRNTKLRLLFTALLALSSHLAWSQVDSCFEQELKSYNPIRSTIPLSFGSDPSSDLVCNREICINENNEKISQGEVLTSIQARKYYESLARKTNCQWNLWELDPKEVSGIWSNKQTLENNSVDQKLDISDLDTVRFLSKGWSRLGSYRVTVNKESSSGTPLQYSLIVSKTVHNYLLRKNLLRKLGYKIPPIKYLKRITIDFDHKDQKKQFIEELTLGTNGSLDRWILSETDKSVVLQDIIAMEDQEFRLNLAKGYLSEDILQNKRIYKSLLIPFALTNVPESINMFDWTIGRIFSGNVKLNFPDFEQYSMTKDDAIWITNRILSLSHDDWWEIVDQTHLPTSVKVLLFEKLKSRRNHLATLFNRENINLKVNTLITNSDDLENGEIKKEFYAGYGRRFRFPDPDSPLSYSEMMALIKSKSMTVGLELLVNAFNSASFTGTDISKKISQFNEKTLAEAVAKNLTTGEVVKTPVKSFAFPTVKGNLILNREIIAGSYLGTDNKIQLVDTVGASVSAGIFGGVTGVYSKTGKFVTTASGVVRQQVPVDLNAKANVFYNRVYSHIRPIESVQKALKYPFKNLFVPALKRKYGHVIDGLMDDEYDTLPLDQKIQTNKKLILNLKKVFLDFKTTYQKLDSKLQADKVLDLIKEIDELVLKHSDEFVNQVDYNQTASNFLNPLLAFEVNIQNEYSTDSKCLEVKIEKICPYNKQGILNKSIDKTFNLADTISRISNKHLIKLDNTQKEQEVSSVINLLNDNLKIGESVIITDSIGGNLGVGAGLNLYNVLKLNLDLSSSKYVVNRLHILRVSDEEIHIYKDLGNVNKIEASLGVRAYVPVIKLSVSGLKGVGRTKFYKVNIGNIDDPFYGEKNLNREQNLKAIRKVLISGSTAFIDKVQTPYILKHHFEEGNDKIGILIWRWNKLRQVDNMEVVLPSGDSKKLYRRVLGQTKGRDGENYVRDLVDFMTAKIFNTQYTTNGFNAGNPGFTFLGKAKNKVLTYEGVLEGKKVNKPYIKLSHILNGWKLKKEQALKELKKLKEKYRYNFFDPSLLAQTKELFLYNINVNFMIYHTGIEHMLSLKEEELNDIWKKFQVRDMKHFTGDDALVKSGISRFLSLKKRYLKLIKNDQIDKASKILLKMVDLVDSKLSAAGILRIYGDAKNFMAIARLDGFRVGDENGDQSLISNTLGQLGPYGNGLQGPLEEVREFLGITTGEYIMSWLLGRII